MKKITFFTALIIGLGISLTSTATAYSGFEYFYFSDATMTVDVGYRGYGECRGSWGVTSPYFHLETCPFP